MKRYLHTALGFIAAAMLLVGMPQIANAGSYQVFVGYADDLRPSPFFPTPWGADSSVGLFAGAGANFDAGAVGIYNNGGTAITINDMKVVLGASGGGQTFQLWGSFLTGGFSLAAGQWAIFTQTSQYNFDTSDFPVLFNNDPTNNCSTGADASTATCLNDQPTVTATVDTVAANFVDTGQVLDTGGYDSVNSNPCVGGNNSSTGNTPGNCNESLQWRLIGTTGVDNPNGTVPEPATLTLLGAGLAGLGLIRRRRRS